MANRKQVVKAKAHAPVAYLGGIAHWQLVMQAREGDEVAAEILALLRRGERVVLNDVEYALLPN